MVVHGARRHQRVHGHVALAHLPVREHDHQAARPGGRLGLGADLVQRLGERNRLGAIEIDHAEPAAAPLDGKDLTELPLGQDRRVHDDALGVFGLRLQDIALRADLGLQRHDHPFAQRVDGRVRDLGELLA